MNKNINSEMITFSNNDSINSRRTKINKASLLNYEKLISFKEKNYSLCKDENTNTYYLFKTDNTKLEGKSALKFIETYFNAFIYFFSQDRNYDSYEYTATVDSDNEVVTIKAHKEIETYKEYIRK